MSPVTAVCDRCHRTVEGFESPNAVIGFYRMADYGPWSRFARPGETLVCNDCMWADPGYSALYQTHRAWRKGAETMAGREYLHPSGWYWRRLPDGSVTAQQPYNELKREERQQVRLAFTAGEWAALVGAMSESGKEAS